MIVFYIAAPLPTIISRRYTDDMNSSSALKEFCYFFTTGIVLSAFALPIVLARAEAGDEQHKAPVVRTVPKISMTRRCYISINDIQIAWGACMLVLTGNIVMFLTIFGFFVAFDNDDGFDYSSWGISY